MIDATGQTAATTASSANRIKLADNFDTFLTLLTAQLQNQDPLSPMDANQFTQQLVQFSQVEQQITTNEQLEQLLATNQTTVASAALGYLGKEALLASPVAGSGGDGANWSYTLAGPAQDVTLEVRDSGGRLVRSESGRLSAGEHVFSWDGLTQDGRQTAPGAYTLTVTARNAQGDPMATTIRTAEVITALDLTGASPQVVTAGGSRPLDQVLSLRERR
jgi:flagellar basal-body rod modification protein FlgD